jgi:hypothetical protein
VAQSAGRSTEISDPLKSSSGLPLPCKGSCPGGLCNRRIGPASAATTDGHVQTALSNARGTPCQTSQLSGNARPIKLILADSQHS